jgi:alpha-glucosidase
MNYRGFMSPLYDWLLVPETGAFAMAGPDLAAQWATYRSAIPFQLAQQQFNLLGSHDTPRLLTMVKGDHGKALAAMVCLFGYLGVPSIYYGDEVGMRGGKDPDNRRCMLWNEHEWDLDWMKIWQSLVRLRSTSPALSYGAIQQLVAERDTLAFLRESPEQRVLVVAHRGQNQVLEVPVWAGAVPERSRWHELLTGQRASVEGGILRVVSNPGQIWMEAR